MTAWLVAAVAALALAAWAWGRVHNELDYFAAARSAGPWLAGLSGTAAGLSAFVFVGGPGWFAAAGVGSLWLLLSAPVSGALQCWAVGEPIVRTAARSGAVTVPDIVAARFGGGWPAGLAALAVLVGAVATLAVQIEGLTVLGDAMLGVPGWQAALAAVLLTSAYTVAGGMRAGLLAEALQGALMAGAAVVLVAATLARAGGPAAAAALLDRLRPELLDPFAATPPTAAAGLFLLFGLGTCAQPHYLQKFLLVRDLRALRWMPAVMTGALIAVVSVWVGVGLGGTALWLGGDLSLDRPDELAPAVLALLGGPLGGIAAAAVLAAVMSTAASLLNIAAAAAVRDLPRAFGRRSDPGLTASRWATAGVAVVAAGVALASDRPVALLGVLGWGMFTAALLPTVMVGLNWPGATRRGAVAALLVGPVVQLGLEAARSAGAVGAAWEPGLTGAAAGVLVMVTVSAVRGRRTGPGTDGHAGRSHAEPRGPRRTPADADAAS